MNLKVNTFNCNVTFSTFPAGEEYVKVVTCPPGGGDITIELSSGSSKEIMRLILLVNALRLHYGKDNIKSLNLSMPYVPYGRQDRKCSSGESHSLKSFATLINSLKFDTVRIVDAHSYVSLAVFDNLIHVKQLYAIQGDPIANNMILACDAIVAPDVGASKKAEEVAKFYGKPVIQCLKTREDSEVELRILGDVASKKLVVLDDICDGGATFNALLTSIPDSYKEISLLVTHGIFSKGKGNLGDYDNVHAIYDWEERQ